MASFFDEDDEKPKKTKSRRTEPVKEAPSVMSAVASRFIITAEDAVVSEAKRRAELQRSRLGGASGAASSVSQSMEPSSLIASMEAAQQARAREREEALIRKLQKERAEEANDPDLIEKDLHVGVFVTAAYRAKLRECGKAFASSSTLKASHTVASDEDDDDDAELTRAAHNPLSTTASFYDTVMHMTTGAPDQLKDAAAVDTHAQLETTPAASRNVSEELAAVVPSSKMTPASTLSDASAELRKEKVSTEKDAARRSRRRQRIDDVVIEAARQRFLLRQQARFEQHARMAS